MSQQTPDQTPLWAFSLLNSDLHPLLCYSTEAEWGDKAERSDNNRKLIPETLCVQIIRLFQWGLIWFRKFRFLWGTNQFPACDWLREIYAAPSFLWSLDSSHHASQRFITNTKCLTYGSWFSGITGCSQFCLWSNAGSTVRLLTFAYSSFLLCTSCSDTWNPTCNIWDEPQLFHFPFCHIKDLNSLLLALVRLRRSLV